MEPAMLLCSHKASPSTSLPFFVSYKSNFIEKPKYAVQSHVSLSTIQAAKSQFIGKSLVLPEKYGYFGNVRKSYVPVGPIAGAVKRRKELSFDNVIQKDKKLKLVLKIRRVLVGYPDRIMSLKELGRYRRELGLTKQRRLIALLKKFPAVFETVVEGAYSLRFRMTVEAERLYLEEMKLRGELEGVLVVKLRKLLMMSINKRILLEKIAHLMTDLGLPLDFRTTITHKHPEYFRVVATERGPALELTHWDPELAISAAELSEDENRARELEEKNLIIDRPLKFNRVRMPKGLILSKSEMRKIAQFRDMPYISPYSDFSELRPGTREKEKHAVGVVHEMLSLTVEKRTLVDHLTHFREEFRFSQQLRGMLIRHPDLFYVSLKGDRDSVFLREAYRDSQLVDKDPLILIKEKFRALVSVPRFSRRGAPKKDVDVDVEGNEDPNESGGEEGDESDIDSYMTDGDYDDDGNWSDEDDDDDDDTPPDFDEDDENPKNQFSRSTKISTISANSEKSEEDKELAPMFPNGRPRERW